MGTKLEPGKFDCYQNALPDEPMFVLLARDLSAPFLVHDWAMRRLEGIRRGERPESDMALIYEAVDCTKNMIEWRSANEGKWRK
jgi:hypothetical protein